MRARSITTLKPKKSYRKGNIVDNCDFLLHRFSVFRFLRDLNLAIFMALRETVIMWPQILGEKCLHGGLQFCCAKTAIEIGLNGNCFLSDFDWLAFLVWNRFSVLLLSPFALFSSSQARKYPFDGSMAFWARETFCVGGFWLLQPLTYMWAR